MILFQMNNSITDIPAHEPHATLLARMEVEASEHPRRYRARIVALALFGHGCIVVAWLALRLPRCVNNEAAPLHDPRRRLY